MMFFTIAFFCTERYVFSTIKSISQVKLKINSFLDKSSTKFRHFRAYCTTNRHIILLFKIFQRYSPLFDKYLSTFCAAAAVRLSVAYQFARTETFVSLRALLCITENVFFCRINKIALTNCSKQRTAHHPLDKIEQTCYYIIK